MTSQVRFWDSFKGDRKWEWYTPPELYAGLDEIFGFKLDPCGALHGPDLAPRSYRLPDEDGLVLPWISPCFVNPPYGDQLPLWLEKAEKEAGRGVRSVFLIPLRSDTAAFHRFIVGRKIYFVKGRVRYGTPEGKGQTAPFGSIVVVFGPEDEEPVYGALDLNGRLLLRQAGQDQPRPEVDE